MVTDDFPVPGEAAPGCAERGRGSPFVWEVALRVQGTQDGGCLALLLKGHLRDSHPKSS